VECYGFRLRERDQLRIRQDRLDAAGLKGAVVGELLRKGKVEAGGKTIRRHEVTEVRPGQTFAFVMDTRMCDGARSLALGADLLLCESTFASTEAALAQESGHLTALQAGTLARDAGVRKLVLAHFSQRYDDTNVLVAEARTVHDDVTAAVEPDPRSDPARGRIAIPERREIRFHGKFEAHVTVETATPDAFQSACDRLGIKCILIELAEGVEPNQPMTESHHEGDLNVVRAEVDGIADQLREAGFTVRRRKVEARYDARGVPERDEETRGLPPSCYFEYHVSVRLEGPDLLKQLVERSSRHGAHVSRNARKKSAGGVEERFVTLRVPRAGRATADRKYADLIAHLREGG